MSAHAAGRPRPSASSRTAAMMAHLSTLVAVLVAVPVACGLVGPLLVWRSAARRGDAFAAGQAREAVDLHLTAMLVGLALPGLPLPAGLVAVAVVGWMALVVGSAGLAYEGRAVHHVVALPLTRAVAAGR